MILGVILLITTWVEADQYVFDHNSTASQETIILNSIYSSCRNTIAGGGSAPAYCTSDCATCTPNTDQREAYVFSQGPTVWFTAVRRALRESRRQEACTIYRGASDALRAQVDAAAGLSAIPTVGAGDTYQWVVNTTQAQEVVIRDSYRSECLRLKSSNLPLLPGCTQECDCTAATTGNRLDHIFQEGFVDWFTAERDRLREARTNQFCHLYLELTRSVQDQIDALLGLPPLP
jgi:hypothetical protein